MKKLAYDKNGKIGTITPEKINLIVNTYRIMGVMNNKIDVNDLIYTNSLRDDFLLNDEEKRYLEKKERITMCVDPNWMPFEKIENNKRTEKEKEKLQLDANMAALKSKSFSELKTTSEQMQWVGLNSEKVMIILVAGFFFLILINKFRHNAP